ncbi:MAG: hypothetical protein HKN25_01340 [Pyrinomonadaceae bacterium]|nr:hypothetical protein [Pyrinomonadaceae bacterium]
MFTGAGFLKVDEPLLPDGYIIDSPNFTLSSFENEVDFSEAEFHASATLIYSLEIIFAPIQLALLALALRRKFMR